MNFMNLMSEMEDIATKTKELLSRAGSKLADAIISRIESGVEKGGTATERDIRNAIKDFTSEEREEILIKALVALAIKQSSSSTPYRKSSAKKTKSGSSTDNFAW